MTYTAQGFAAGFTLMNHSASGSGTAFAGVTASAEDITTLFFNPAGLTEHSGTQVIVGLSFLNGDSQFKTSGSTDILGATLSGGEGGNAISEEWIPYVYVATDILGDLRLGVGVNAPFGISTDYHDRWRGRYHALKSEMKTININPTLAYAINDQFSIGMGVSAQYIDVKLSNAIDFGTVCLGVLPAVTCGGLGLLPQMADGKITSQGDDWGWGYNLGVLYEPVPGTRIGLAYRSKISHTVKGNARFDVPAAALPLTIGGAFSNSDGQSDLDLPESLSVGIFHQVNPKWAIMGDIKWTRWNRFKELRLEFENPAQPANIEPQEWENSMRYALGLRYQSNPSWIFRIGLSYEETPVPRAKFRSARFGDSSRYGLNLGASYSGFKHLTLDVGYAHNFFDDAKINSTTSQGHNLNGEFQTETDIVSAQMGLRF